MVPIKTNLANRKNYGSSRYTKNIKYIVIHYTGNDGDHDESNGNYFKQDLRANGKPLGSAHYFVDSDSITQSVPDNYVAWSVGGSKYKNTKGGKFYGKCTNTNSISIELCDDVRNRVIYPSAKTIANALELTKSLMDKYNIPVDRVIRHYDVNGKLCPAYWVDDAKWLNEFKSKLGTVVANDKVDAPANTNSLEYKVRITANALNVRTGASTAHKVVTTVRKGQVYTIVQTVNGWGKLKSGVGWIHLGYTTRV